MTVDREQIQRDEERIARIDRAKIRRDAHRYAHDAEVTILALLAELEKVEKERDERMSAYSLSNAIEWGFRFPPGHPARVMAEALKPARDVEQDPSSGMWYVIDQRGERLHGPYLAQPHPHTNHHRHVDAGGV